MFEPVIAAKGAADAKAIHALTPAGVEAFLAGRPAARALAQIGGFTGKAGQVLALPGETVAVPSPADARAAAVAMHVLATSQ